MCVCVCVCVCVCGSAMVSMWQYAGLRWIRCYHMHLGQERRRSVSQSVSQSCS